MANHALKERIYFLYKFVQQPLSVGSITPSSSYLAKMMFKDVNWDKTTVIVELGAGTGVFTQTIYEQKKTDCQALIFEQDCQMRTACLSPFNIPCK